MWSLRLRPMSPPLSSATRRDLKARAQRLEATVKLGHAGVTDAFLKSLDTALTTHGLVKVRFGDFKDEKKALAPQIAEQTGSELIQRVGNVAVYFRAKPDGAGLIAAGPLTSRAGPRALAVFPRRERERQAQGPGLGPPREQRARPAP